MWWTKEFVLWASIISVSANAVQKTNRNIENFDADTFPALADRLANLERRLYNTEELNMKQSNEIDSLSQVNKQLVQELYQTKELSMKQRNEIDSLSQVNKQLVQELYTTNELYKKQSIEILRIIQENKQLLQESYTTNKFYKKQSSEVSHLTQEMSQLKQGAYEIEKYCVKQTVENERLNKELKELSKTTAIFVQLQKQKTGPLKGHIADCGQSKGLRNRRFLQANTFVAFSAYLDHPVQHLGLDQSIIFNHVLFNDGGAYNNRSGIFTCPGPEVIKLFFCSTQLSMKF